MCEEFNRRSMIRLQFLLAVYPHYCCQGAYQLNWANSGPLNKLLALFEEGNQIKKLAQIQNCTVILLVLCFIVIPSTKLRDRLLMRMDYLIHAKFKYTCML